jgi:hypothetical protein
VANETRRKIRWTPHLPEALAAEPRRAGPAELFTQVAPLLAGGRTGQDAIERLAELLQEDPALIDLRFDEAEVLHAVRTFVPGSPLELDDEHRAVLFARTLPSLVPPRFGRKAAEALGTAAARRTEPLDRLALALGRYLAILDDVEGAAGAGQNPLWQLLLELTWGEARAAAPEGRDVLHLPDGEAPAPAAARLVAGISR